MILQKLKKIVFTKKEHNTKKIKIILNNIIETTCSDKFCKKLNISNTFNSRFELIIILVFLLYLRFKEDEKNKIKLQFLYDYLFEYVDFSLREIGTGDLSVGKKVKKMARIFSIRMKNYSKSTSVKFLNIKKPIKKNIYKNKISQRYLDLFYIYINNQNKKLYTTPINKIFTKNFFKPPI